MPSGMARFGPSHPLIVQLEVQQAKRQRSRLLARALHDVMRALLGSVVETVHRLEHVVSQLAVRTMLAPSLDCLSHIRGAYAAGILRVTADERNLGPPLDPMTREANRPAECVRIRHL